MAAESPPTTSTNSKVGISLGVKDFNVDSYAARLVDAEINLKEKLNIALELRDNIDQISQHQDYARYLSTLLPAFLGSLRQAKISLNASTNEHKFRSTILTLIHRFPPSPSISANVDDLFSVLLNILRTDNEDNGWLCVKIIIDLVRSFKKEAEGPSKHFLEVFKGMLEQMPAVVEEVFPNDGSGICSDITRYKGEQNQQRDLLPAFKSFKVITECPIAVVCIVQSYQHSLAQYMLDTFVTLSVNILQLEAGPQRKLHEEAAKQGKNNTTISPLIKNRNLYCEFIFSQVKTVSFIAYVCRAWHSYVTPHAQTLAKACLRLLKDCPTELYSARKEILVATRHIAGINEIGRPAFLSVFNELLDDKVIVGEGIMTRETLRVLGMGLLADVFGTVRGDLSFDQIRQTLNKALVNMLDPTLPPHAHSISIKKIVALIDRIVTANNVHESDGNPNEMLHMIVHALISKLKSIKLFKDDLVQMRLVPGPRRGVKENNTDNTMEVDGDEKDTKDDKNGYDEKFNQANKIDEIQVEQSKPVGALINVQEPSSEKVRDARITFRFTLQASIAAITAFKHLPVSSATGPKGNLNAQGSAGPSSEALCEFFKASVQSFGLYDRKGDKEGAENLENFFTALLRVEALVFQDVMQKMVPYLIDEILEHPPLFNAINVFLNHEPQSQIFLSILIKFFIENLQVFSTDDHERITLFHKLFKHIMSSITPPNDYLFSGCTGTIMLKSIRLAHKSKNPYNYLILLKILSQAIGGGRYEKFYMEIQSLLQSYIDGLTNLLDESDRPNREIIIQLFLILPMRFQVVLPFLSSLTRPLCMALESENVEILEQALRLVEICVETLNPLYVDPILTPYIRQIQMGIYKLLKPVPHNHKLAHTAVRILGKLGGRNRKAINKPATVDAKVVDQPLSINVAYHEKESLKKLNLISFVRLAIKAIENTLIECALSISVDKVYNRSADDERAISILKHSLAPLLLNGVNGLVQENSYREILDTLINAATTTSLSSLSLDFVKELVVFVMKREIQFVYLNWNDGIVSLSRLGGVTLDCIANCLTTAVSRDEKLSYDLVLFSVNQIVELVAGVDEDMKGFIFNQLSSRFSSLCHDQLWRYKLAGLKGMTLMISDDVNLGEKWISSHQIEFYRAAVYILKDMPLETPVEVDLVIDFIRKLIDICNGPQSITHDSALEFMDASRPSTPAASTANPFNSGNRPIESPSLSSTSGQGYDSVRYQFNHLISILIADLTSPKDIVRKNTQNTLSQLSEKTGMAIKDLLAPGKSVLSSAIYHKPLRALPVPMQTARIDAVTYCLQLRPQVSAHNTPQPDDKEKSDKEKIDNPESAAPPNSQSSGVLEISEDLTRFVHEVLGISDAEDVAIIGQRPSHIVQLALADLRVACVRLLTAATSTSDIFRSANQARMRIISVYFKSLYARSSELHGVAHDGIKQVLVQSGKVPKELLQTALKPILINLSDTRKINIAGLDGLARLLELLTNYFKVEIGTKLLEHFKSLLDEKDLKAAPSPKINLPPNATIQQQQQASVIAAQTSNQPPLSGDLADLHDVKIMVAIANVFRLLPSAANIYLEQFSNLIVQTEQRFRRVLGSPWTTPLAQYLDRFPNEANDFFLARMDSAEHFNTYRAALTSPHAENLRADVLANPERLVNSFFSSEALSKPGFALHGLKIVRALIDIHPNILAASEQQRSVLWESIWGLWSQHVQSDKPIADIYIRTKEIETLLEILLLHLINHPDPAMLIYMAEVFTLKLPLNLIGLSRFYIKNVALSTSSELKHVTLSHFVNKIPDENLSQSHKMFIVRHIVNPIAVVAKYRPEENVIDEGFIGEMHNKIWSPYQKEEELSEVGNGLFIELLNFSATLVDVCPDLLGEFKKDVIKFGWLSQRHVDASVKHSGYILICRFLRAFDSPSKITREVYVGLLKSVQPETKAMTKEALDILTPVLPQRVPEKAPAPVSHLPQWAIRIRRVLVEEQQSAAQLSTIYSLIIRHSDMFYPIRELFVPHMLNSITRMGIIPSAANDTRQLSIDVLELILHWEQRRLADDEKLSEQPQSGDKRRASESFDEQPAAKRTRSSTATSTPQPGSSTPQPSTPKTFVLHQNLKGHAINYLVRFASISSEPISSPASLSARAIGLLRGYQALDSHNDISAKLAYFLKVLAQSELKEESATVHCNSAEVLCALALPEQDSYFNSNLAGLAKIIEKCFTSNINRLHLTLEPLVKRIFSILPSITEEDDSQQGREVKAFSSMIENIINDGLSGSRNPHNALCLLRAWTDVQPDKFDMFIPAHMRLLQIITREHSSADKKPSYLIDPKLVPLTLDLPRRRVSQLGDARRIFLTCMVLLIERSTSSDVIKYILEMIKTWITEKNNAFPTAREKAGLLIKMMSIEERQYDIKGVVSDAPSKEVSQKLFNEYLELILSIYKDSFYARSEMTVRLENAFLLGCRASNHDLRSSFIEVFHESMYLSVASRLQYVLGVQNWDSLSNVYWIHQALDLVLGSIKSDELIVSGEYGEDAFVANLKSYRVDGLIDAVRHLQYMDDYSAHDIWITVFGSAWASINRKEQAEITRHMIGLLAQEYHLKQVDSRPNVIQTILDGILTASPSIALPPHLVKYLGKTFSAWHTAILLLEQLTVVGRESEMVNEISRDALAEIYADLAEEDLFYGLWRRRSGYPETNAALSYEQLGLWSEAQIMHENAQIKARAGNVPFNEPEYAVWEDHWVLCSQKLQQWDLLTDLAKNESNADLLFECAWRTSDWSQDREVIEGAFKNLADIATPRRRIFEAFMSLVKAQDTNEPSNDFNKITTEAIQLSLKKWHSLPDIPGPANIPLLHTFQQCVELWDASNIFHTFAATNETNVEQRSSEIKNIVHQWRDRMPNLWDDINLWSDLVAWRSHVFQAINKVYLPIINNLQANGNGQTNTGQNSFGYRGYHEMAWTINQFAHVARKHQLQDVCISLLTKIYTLPNIEIQEAFLKLREQARCLYPTTDGLGAGLEVINNTNLHFFAPSQKSEFFTLKGMFTAKLGLHDDATQSFAHAVQTDLNLPRAWAEWGRYNDQQFKVHPENMSLGANAISCYLQASGLYRNHKSRKLLARVLWLLSLDDVNMTISKAFEAYKGDFQVWYWITLIPQLLLSLSHREARHARLILIQIAKKYPQALFFHLRTTREEYTVLRRQAQAVAVAKAERGEQGPNPHLAPPAQAALTPQLGSPATANAKPQQGMQQQATQGQVPLYKNPWDWVDEVLSILKTAYPLLTLSLETMVDQIAARFKSSPEEDGYRFVNALLGDAIMNYATRDKGSSMELSPTTRQALNKFIEQAVIGKQKPFVNEPGLGSELQLSQYIRKLMIWRKRFEKVLDSRPRFQSLEYSRRHLVEFHLNKYDQIEIPGQYNKHEDEDRSTFLKIARIAPKFEFYKSHGVSWKRITFVAVNGTRHPFMVQMPPTRHVRREERTQQICRIFNAVIDRRKECRRRNIYFNAPLSVPLSTNLRLVQNDPSTVSLEDISNKHCEELGEDSITPILTYIEKLKSVSKADDSEITTLNLKMEIIEEIANKYVPEDVLTRYMNRSANSPSEFWMLRKQMSNQVATIIFMTYAFCIAHRQPHRIMITPSTGSMHTTDVIPGLINQDCQLSNPESVPFRLTPNLQHYLTSIGIEGVLVSSIVSLGRCLTEPQYDLENQLNLFVREDVSSWYTNQRRQSPSDGEVRNSIQQNVDGIVARATVLGCKYERDQFNLNQGQGQGASGGSTNNQKVIPACQSVLDLIAKATNPIELAKMDPQWAPWI
ncbi:hypothetical protein E3P89_00202 [Wallemia ichthyophaga]|uniref:Transcription-associated protein 1 n=1 Tax=Wallemia ichthyophaga TaxID=245174 RepID=A0A4T0IB55_WALIC|nr:hypothetical protein E3P90_00361 [Wallemia ichthyophaga]TIB18330.1 hypothetical protein E3P93_00218 [Wallemia ichthyophaga]TIB25963.1 hypothetical protein E3P89_00202 [Wallemia ichthyophaga]